MWNLDFITENQLMEHVTVTIEKYGEKLCSFDLERFNKNIIDPIKMIFDKTVYKASWEEIVKNEIFRQRDKSNNNDIGYFHQNIFKYIKNCRVPANGRDGGWDVIFEPENLIQVTDDTTVKRIFVELKNKHNTMNSASSSKTFIKMQNQLLQDDSCACFLVEAIAQTSQNIMWQTTVDGQRMKHKLIRRVSIDKFYELVTGEKDAFFKLCMVLPEIIKKVVDEHYSEVKNNDTVYDEILKLADRYSEFGDGDDNDLAIAIAFYMLAFSSYNGFNRI